MFTRFLIALLAILFSALPSHAQWDSRFWPANEKPVRAGGIFNRVYQADVITSNIAFAVKERVEAISKEDSGYVIDDITGNMPRKPETSLSEAKQILRGRISSFLDQTRFPSPYQPSSAQITNLVYWSVSNILVHCNLPTNFFDYTPPRNLAGHPGITSTNIDYSQYGWDAMRTVVTNLVYTYEPKGIMENLTKTISLTGIMPYDENIPGLGQYQSPNGSCENNNEQDGPFNFDELTIANYVSELGFNKTAIRALVGIGKGAWHMQEYGSGNAGIISAFIGPSSIIDSNSAHTAHSFFLDSSGGEIGCGFSTNQPLWEYGGTINGKSTTSDGFVFISGASYGVDEPTCNLWSPNVMGDFFVKSQQSLDYEVYCYGMLVYFGGAFTDTVAGYSANERREYRHIIQWNFTYK
jgi:hypothetical protein